MVVHLFCQGDSLFKLRNGRWGLPQGKQALPQTAIIKSAVNRIFISLHQLQHLLIKGNRLVISLLLASQLGQTIHTFGFLKGNIQSLKMGLSLFIIALGLRPVAQHPQRFAQTQIGLPLDKAIGFVGQSLLHLLKTLAGQIRLLLRLIKFSLLKAELPGQSRICRLRQSNRFLKMKL